jgi:multidrug efflux pump subunit AcrB
VLDIERTVTYPIEKAVSAVSDVKFVESKSRQGLSTVRVWMNWGADVNNGQTEAIQRIQQILNSLPTGIKQPFIVRFDLSNLPVVLVTASGGGLDERQLYDLAYNTIEPQLERLGGVASASVDGGRVRQITVNLNRDQLWCSRPSSGRSRTRSRSCSRCRWGSSASSGRSTSRTRRSRRRPSWGSS